MKRNDFRENSTKFSIFLRNFLIFSENDRKNDRENGSSGKRLRNEKERNGMIFHSFSSIFRIFSVCFPHKKAPDASRTEGSEILTKFPT